MAMVLKLLFASLIFIIGFLGGILPIFYKNTQRSERLLYYGDYFARGIFLSVGLIHLLPDGAETFHHIRPHIHYPVVFMVCVMTVFVIQLIEQATSKFAAKTAFAQNWMPYLLLILLSIHSIIAGTVLGIDNAIAHMIVIFIAIIAHKGAEAFALGMSMRTHKIAIRVRFMLIALFSLMTPFGIIASSIISNSLDSQQASLAQAIFSGMAAGTFLYIASFKADDLEDSIKDTSNLTATGFFGLGVVVMAWVALYL